jgi:hypothetical protein
MDDLKIVYLDPHELTPYENNTRKHSPEDIDQIKASIEADGFNDPIGVWGENNLIVEGHGRQIAALEMGLDKVPCIRLDHMTETQRRDYAIRHNRTAELSGWDFGKLEEEIAALEIEGVDLSGLKFDFAIDNGYDFFSRENRNDTGRQEGNDEYNEFLDKFEQKKTTDDCYTPDNIYEVIAEWVEKEYKVKRSKFVRPFFPGGDYESEDYPAGCVVVDNPPFSILANIVDFYVANEIKFFLFAPGLATLNYVNRENVCAICTYASITYENGASVTTSFLTNMGDPDIIAKSAPELYKAIEAANDENEKAMHKQLPKYEFPGEVLTAAKFGWLAKYGQAMNVKRKDCVMIRQLDAMKEADKGIFGGALLLSEKAAAEKAAAEKAAAHVWELSEREWQIIKSLGHE